MGVARREVRGRQVCLRQLQLEDAPAILERINDPEVVRWTTRIPHPYPADGARTFIEQALNQWEQGTAYTYAVIPASEQELVGVIALSNVFEKHGCAEVGFWLGRKSWGKGLMTEAVRLIRQVAFDDLSLFRLYASAFEANAASRRVLEKAGFQLEGVMRQAVVRYGTRHNYMNYGLLQPEYVSEVSSAVSAAVPTAQGPAPESVR